MPFASLRGGIVFDCCKFYYRIDLQKETKYDIINNANNYKIFLCFYERGVKMSNVIKKIHIKNFRSIVDETIDCSELNLFVGKNDVGKSNILKALDLFFHYDKNTFVFSENFSLFHKTAVKKAKEILI